MIVAGECVSKSRFKHFPICVVVKWSCSFKTISVGMKFCLTRAVYKNILSLVCCVVASAYTNEILRNQHFMRLLVLSCTQTQMKANYMMQQILIGWNVVWYWYFIQSCRNLFRYLKIQFHVFFLYKIITTDKCATCYYKLKVFECVCLLFSDMKQPMKWVRQQSFEKCSFYRIEWGWELKWFLLPCQTASVCRNQLKRWSWKWFYFQISQLVVLDLDGIALVWLWFEFRIYASAGEVWTCSMWLALHAKTLLFSCV